jgi:hypothetical protein
LSGCAPFLKQELITADQDIRLNAVSKRPYVLLYRVRISDADKRPYCTSFRNPVSKNQEGLLFKANTSSTLLETVAEVVPVRLGGKEYTVRYPNDTTLEDWKRLNFSESEAMFLNDLNFAPSILEAAFLLPTFKTQLDSSGNRYLIDTNNRRLTGSWEEDLVSLNVKAPKPDAAEKWKGELVSWLKGLVTFKCFQDKDLLTRTECIELGEFMNTVYDFFLKYPDAIRALPGKRKEQLEAEEKANEKLDPFTDTTLPVQTSGPGEFMSEPTGIHWMDDFQWQNVNPIEVVQPDVSGAPVSYSIGILLVKHSKTRGDEYKFGSIQVQANDIEEAKRAIKSRVMQLREKYPYYSFIY